MKNKNLTIGFALLFILIALVVSGWFMIKPQPIILQGEVEATQVKVASKIVGRISNLFVKEGQKVKVNDILVDIDSPEVQAKLKQAQAAQKAAKAQSRKAEKGARTEQISAAYNMWQKAKAASELAKKTFARVENLFKEGVIAAQKRDEAETKMKAAELTEKAAKSQYDMATKGARVEDKEAALALFDQASGAVSEVESYINETKLKSPIDAEISSINAERGELITPGFPVFTLVDLNDVWVSFNVREDYLSKIKMGDIFEAKFPALGNKVIKLKINYINSLGGFATWRATKSSGDFDIKTFEVRAVPIESVKGMRPGMTALVNWTALK